MLLNSCKSFKRIYLIFIICFIVAFNLLSRTVEKPKNTKPVDEEIPIPETKACVVMMDSRFRQEDYLAASATSLKELKQFINTRTDKIGFPQRSLLINKAYSLKFGYDFVISNATQYEFHLKEYPKRHSVWLKPVFIQDVLEKRPDCEWLAYLDSDAYLWMDQHTVSLDDYFATASINDASVGYDEYSAKKLQTNGYYPWKDQQAYFMIGLDGLNMRDRRGWPSPALSIEQDYACAGVFFIKNCKKSKQLVDEWIHGPADMTPDIQEAYDFFATNWAREQSILDRIILPKHARGMYIYSFKDFVDPDGTVIRHVWSDISEERDFRGDQDLKELLLI